MRIGRNSSREHELERRLRNERPQAREAFVLMLSPAPGPMPAPLPRRTGLVRGAVIVAVTAAIAAALASTGSLDYATNSLHHAGHILANALRSPKGDTFVSVTPYGPTSSQSPFQVQAGASAAVCQYPQLIAVPIQEVFYLLLHGAKPPSSCSG